MSNSVAGAVDIFDHQGVKIGEMIIYDNGTLDGYLFEEPAKKIISDLDKIPRSVCFTV